MKTIKTPCMKHTKHNDHFIARTLYSCVVISIAFQYNGWSNVNTESWPYFLAKSDTNNKVK